jgi:hypothetical protein
MEGFGQVYEIQDDGKDVKLNEALSAADHVLLTKAREKLGSRWIKIALSPLNDLTPTPNVPQPAINAQNEIKLEYPENNVRKTTMEPETTPCTSIECTSTNPDHTHHAHRKLVHDSGIFESYIWDPICGMQALIEAPWGGEGFCRQCVDTMKDKWRKRREEAWRDLDLWFGLTGTV